MRRSSALLLALALALASALLASCDRPRCVGGYVQPDFDRLEGDLGAARARWTAANIGDYTYTLERFSGPTALGAVTVTVREDAVQSVTPGGPENPGTLDDLFAVVDQAITDAGKGGCHDLSVTYDPVDGHLTSFASDLRQRNVADGLSSWNVSTFTRP